MSVDICVASIDQGEKRKTRSFQSTAWLSSVVEVVFFFSLSSIDAIQIVYRHQVGVRLLLFLNLFFIIYQNEYMSINLNNYFSITENVFTVKYIIEYKFMKMYFVHIRPF